MLEFKFATSVGVVYNCNVSSRYTLFKPKSANIMKRIIAIFSIALLMSACNGGKIISQEQYDAYIEQLGWALPDSLKTPEQRLIRQKMVKLLYSNTKVKNNQLCLMVDRDFFVEQGLPAFCYDVALFEYAQTNSVIKEFSKTTGSDIKLEDIWNQAKEEIRID